MHKVLPCVFALCLGPIAHSAASEKGAAAPAVTRPPAYAVLDKFLGTWDSQVEMVATDGKKSMQASRNTFEWDLHGRFLKDAGGDVGGATSFLGLWSYDPQAKRYESWYFQGPSGQTLHITYAWDDKNQTLTGTQDLGGGMTLEAKDRFLDQDHYDWSIVVKDKEGRQLNRLSAHSARVPKSPPR